MPYRVELKPSADKALSTLPENIQRRIVARLTALSEEPRPRGVVKLAGREQIFRLRVGNYRILFQVHDELQVVVVVAIAHRKEAYRGR